MECQICKKETELSLMKRHKCGKPDKCNKCNAAYLAIRRGGNSEHLEIIRIHKLKVKLKRIRNSMPETPYEGYLRRKHRNSKYVSCKKPPKIKEVIIKEKKPTKREEKKELSRVRKIEKQELRQKEKLLKRNALLAIRAYRQENRKRLNSEYAKRLRDRNPNGKAELAIRNMMYRAIKGTSRVYIKDVGYTSAELINHLGGMPNRKLHIDHKIPLSWFVPGTHFSIINNLKNMHLISAFKNRSKKNRYADPVCIEFFNESYCFIKNEYRNMISVA